MMLYLLKLLLSSALLCSSYSAVRAFEESSLVGEQSVEMSDFENDFVAEAEDWQWDNDDTTSNDALRAVIDPIAVMTILNLLGVPAILQEPIFLHTNILNKRSLLDQPIFEPDRPEFPGKWVLGVNAFARKTTRSNFTRGSDKLESWLALSQSSLIAKLEEAIDTAANLNPDIQVDIAQIFALFENMTVEERDVGFMLHWMKRWRNVTLRIMFPLYYLESNFSLTEKEQEEVARVLGVFEPEEERRFRKAHLISDRIGMGDTRVEVDGTVLRRPSFTLRCGGLATIPTAFTWGGAFLGSFFAKPSVLPTFELDQIFDAISSPNASSTQDAINILREFLLDAFDRIAADLIDVPLGNRGHLGLGVYIRGKVPLSTYFNTWFAERLKIANRISVELFVPAREKRFFINKIDEVAFGNHNFEDTDMAAENLQFLQEQAVARLFLRAFSTKIIPGVIFRWTSGMYYKGDIFGFNLGTDFWLQNKARISSISVSEKTLQEIDIPKAKQPVAQQSKIFGAFLFKHKTNKATWFFSLNADASLNTKGLGQEYSLAINIESSF